MKGKVTMSTIQKKEFAVKTDLSEKANLINIINENLKEQNIVSTVLTEDDVITGTPEALVISGNDFTRILSVYASVPLLTIESI